MMCLNTMKPGALYSKSSTNAGFGPLCAEEHGKSLLLQLVTEVKRLVDDYGSEFLKTTVDAFPTVISGKPTKKFCLRKLTIQLVKTVDRPITGNDGTVLCANVRHGMFAKLFPSLKRMPFITW